MRLVEIITVYLAVAAPFAVSYFLRLPARSRRRHKLAFASAAGLLWPLVVLSYTLTRGSGAHGITDMKKNPTPPRAELPLRRLLDALRRLEDAARDACGAGGEPTVSAALDACAKVERHTALTLACLEARADAEPAEHELELARAAGRAGADLEVAGRCLHRRNVARLEAHRRNSRVEMLHALADLPDSFAPSLLARPSDFQASRRLYSALLPAYTAAIELLSQLEDARAVQTVARLFDSAAARLRQLDALARSAAPADETGDQSCKHSNTHPDTQPAGDAAARAVSHAASQPVARSVAQPATAQPTSTTPQTTSTKPQSTSTTPQLAPRAPRATPTARA
jgi:hypothetical protein